MSTQPIIISDEGKAVAARIKQREDNQAAVDVLNANEYLGYSDWAIHYGNVPSIIYTDHISTPSNKFWVIELSAAVALAATMPKVKAVKK